MSFRAVWGALAVASLWGGGFWYFISDMPVPLTQLPPKTQAIVVLTGGANRLESALDLWTKGIGQYLFISGVQPGVRLDQLFPKTIEVQESARVILDHKARSTRENAIFSLAWLKTQNLSRIILVTATYHMKRSLLEFMIEGPDLEIVPYPVEGRALKQQNWWEDYKKFYLFVSEYHKYLGSVLRFCLKRYLL